MNHLDDFTLNEYLDHALDKSKRDAADLHLQTCTECQGRLEQLQSVLAELDAVPEIQLEHDLTQSILARLPQKAPIRVWTRAFAAQVGVALGFVFWLGMQAVPFVRAPQFALPKIPSVDVQALSTRLLTLQLPFPEFRFPTFSYQLPSFAFQTPTITLYISTAQMLTIFVSVVLLWVVGNVVLLRSRLGVR